MHIGDMKKIGVSVLKLVIANTVKKRVNNILKV